jgi:hypothetical protein
MLRYAAAPYTHYDNSARRRQRHTARMQCLTWMREKAGTTRLVYRSKDPARASLLLQNLMRTGCAKHKFTLIYRGN